MPGFTLYTAFNGEFFETPVPPKTARNYPKFLTPPHLLPVFIATMGGFCQGYEVGGTAQIIAMPSFRKYFGLLIPDGNGGWVPSPDATNLDGNIVSLCIAGSIVGAALLIFLGDYIGRKGALFVGSGTLAIGAAIMAASTSIGMLYAGRIIGGFGIGFLSGTIGVYLAEISPKEVRGAITSGFQLMITSRYRLGPIQTAFSPPF